MKIATTEELQDIERAYLSTGITTDQLIEKAGSAVAGAIREYLGSVVGKDILVLVGPGNNGSDGLSSVANLNKWGARTTAYIVLPRPHNDPHLSRCSDNQVRIINSDQDKEYQQLLNEISRSDLIIDAILGTGKSRPIGGKIAEVLTRLAHQVSNQLIPIVAIDTPTGIDLDSGSASELTPKANITIALSHPKPGHFIFPAATFRGDLVIANIGIPEPFSSHIERELMTHSIVKDHLTARPLDSHKGTYGHSLILGGSPQYSGAAYLASQGALRVGSGLVTLATSKSIHPVLSAKSHEVITLALPANLDGAIHPKAAKIIGSLLPEYDAIGIGCGMGTSVDSQNFIRLLLSESHSRNMPTLIDADGLNNLSKIVKWWELLPDNSVITPHPGEMARLTGVDVKEIQDRREQITSDWASFWNVTIVLKGAFTVIANAKGMIWISPFANPILSTGGTGDVLSGIITGLMAQGVDTDAASCCGVYLHGSAGQALSEKFGGIGIASDLLPLIPQLIKSINDGRF